MNVLNKWSHELQQWDPSDQHELIQNPRYTVHQDSYDKFKCIDKTTNNEYSTNQQEIQIGSRVLKTGALKLQKEGCHELNDEYKTSCDDFFGMINARDQSYRTVSNEIDKHLTGKQSEKVMDSLTKASSLTKCIQQRKKYTDECVCVGDKGHYEYIAILENLREHYDLTINSCAKGKFDLSDVDKYVKYDYPYTEFKTDILCKCYMLDKNGNPIKKKNIESNFIIKDIRSTTDLIMALMTQEFKTNPKSSVVYLSDLKKDSITIKSLNKFLLLEITNFPIEIVAIALKQLHTEYMEKINEIVEYITNEYYQVTRKKDNPKLKDLCKLGGEIKEICTLFDKIFNIVDSNVKGVQTQRQIPKLRWSRNTKWQDIYEVVKLISYSMMLKIKAGLKDYFLN
jgi:hypothetical protein